MHFLKPLNLYSIIVYLFAEVEIYIRFGISPQPTVLKAIYGNSKLNNKTFFKVFMLATGKHI